MNRQAHFRPLTPIMHPWVADITAHADLLRQAIDEYGSPVNIHCLQPFNENLTAFGAVFHEKQLDYRIYFARKANKCLSFAVRSHGLFQGIDTASYRELHQCLIAGIPAEALLCTAAVKTPDLLELAIARGVEVVIDNEDECRLMQAIATRMGRRVTVNIRVGGFTFEGKSLHTRFGWDIREAAVFVTNSIGKGNRFDRLDYSGLHFHLNGYSIAQRGEAILQCLALADRLRGEGFHTATLDIGGGILVNYLQYRDEWDAFNRTLKDAVEGKVPPLTYLNHPLGMTVLDGKALGEPQVYPYYSRVYKEHFLRRILEHRGSSGSTVAEEIRKRKIAMRMEPGRSALDQCGITVARVAFRKTDNRGNLLVGLEMNGTQLRSSSADFLLDPLHIPSAPVAGSTPPEFGFLVGAYCLEQELILKRCVRFLTYPQVGDLMVFVNTAGYLMHFYESEAHQFELAANTFLVSDGKRIIGDSKLANSLRINAATDILGVATQMGIYR